ncbi:MAG: hypothetical protein NC210_02370 [[Clostridium] fimetarium]|nr:transporter [Alistipes timonensis]MCM1405246.1 hypothetical protein [[Clostridium] fimetarium]
MRLATFRQKIKPWMLPIAMLLGVLFHDSIGHVAFLSRYLIFTMLLITYCRLKTSDFHVGRYIWLLLAAQIGGAVGVYLLIRPFDEVLAQGAFICVFCPTATAAPVITGMLGGSVGRVAVYSFFSHISVALLAPLLLTWIGGEGTAIGFADSLLAIARSVLPLILGPLAIAALMGRFAPKAKEAVAGHQGLSFYIWAVALLIVVGNSVSFLMREPASAIPQILLLALAALIACVLQFGLGRKIGARYADRVSGAQSLGQKNTVLAIWLALTYLNPLASAAPAAYVAWHNIVNSWQIYRSGKR